MGVHCGRALLCPGLLLLHFLLDRVDVVPLRQCGRSPPRIMRPLPSTIDLLAVPTSTATRSYEGSAGQRGAMRGAAPHGITGITGSDTASDR